MKSLWYGVFTLVCILLILSCNIKPTHVNSLHVVEDSSAIDSIHVFLISEDVIFCVRKNRSSFFEGFSGDAVELYSDTILKDPDIINETMKLIRTSPKSDSLSYYSSQISYEMKKYGNKIRFIENSMDNRGAMIIYYRDSLEFVWLSQDEMERGNLRYDISNDFRLFLRQLRKPK